MRRARRADDDRIAELALQLAVVRHPAEGNLSEREVVLLRDGLDLGERVEVGLVPVAGKVAFTLSNPN